MVVTACNIFQHISNCRQLVKLPLKIHFMYVCMCLYRYPQRPEWGIVSLQARVPGVVSILVWVLGSELYSSGRLVNAPPPSPPLETGSPYVTLAGLEFTV